MLINFNIGIVQFYNDYITISKEQSFNIANLGKRCHKLTHQINLIIFKLRN